MTGCLARITGHCLICLMYNRENYVICCACRAAQLLWQVGEVRREQGKEMSKYWFAYEGVTAKNTTNSLIVHQQKTRPPTRKYTQSHKPKSNRSEVVIKAALLKSLQLGGVEGSPGHVPFRRREESTVPMVLLRKALFPALVGTQ